MLFIQCPSKVNWLLYIFKYFIVLRLDSLYGWKSYDAPLFPKHKWFHKLLYHRFPALTSYWEPVKGKLQIAGVKRAFACKLQTCGLGQQNWMKTYMQLGLHLQIKGWLCVNAKIFSLCFLKLASTWPLYAGFCLSPFTIKYSSITGNKSLSDTTLASGQNSMLNCSPPPPPPPSFAAGLQDWRRRNNPAIETDC